jgi:putative transposase
VSLPDFAYAVDVSTCKAILMLNFKRMRFPTDVILVCIRWYAAYPLNYRHLEEMMEERGVFVDHSSINR